MLFTFSTQKRQDVKGELEKDSSNYPPAHSLYSTTRKARLGCVKDEAGGKLWKEWVLLRTSVTLCSPVRRKLTRELKVYNVVSSLRKCNTMIIVGSCNYSYAAVVPMLQLLPRGNCCTPSPIQAKHLKETWPLECQVPLPANIPYLATSDVNGKSSPVQQYAFT
jgi:hypothetical protein